MVLAVGCGDDGVDPTADPTIAAGGGDVEPCPEQSRPAPVAIEVGVVLELPDDGAGHVVCADYETRPPASGDHFAAWQNCGFYRAPVQDQTAVHALEHGAVWIAFQSDLGEADVAAIEARVGRDGHLLAAPYPGLRNPIVLTAWTRQLAVESFDDPMVEEFIADHLARRSPTAPEAGASCGDAIGDAPDAPNARYAEILEQVSG